MSDIEQEIQAKGLTAPRVTPAAIEAVIASEHYFTAQDGAYGAFMREGSRYGDMNDGTPWPINLDLLTLCVLVLKNGFTVTGESACASPENFDAELGRKIARKNAVDKIWPLMGYELHSKLAEAKQSMAQTVSAIDKAWDRFQRAVEPVKGRADELNRQS